MKISARAHKILSCMSQNDLSLLIEDVEGYQSEMQQVSGRASEGTIVLRAEAAADVLKTLADRYGAQLEKIRTEV